MAAESSLSLREDIQIEQIQTLTNRLDKLEKQFSSMKSKDIGSKIDAKNNFKDLQEKNKSLKNKIDSLTKKNDQTNEKIISLTNRLRDIEKSTSRLYSDLQRSQEQNTKEQSIRIKFAIELCEKLANKVDAKYSSKIQSKHENNPDYEKKLNELFGKYDIVVQNQSQQIAELKTKHDDDVLALVEENRQTKNELTALNTTVMDELGQLNEKFDLISNRLNEINETLISNKTEESMNQTSLDAFEMLNNENGTNSTTTIIEQIKSLRDEVSVLSDRVNDIDEILASNNIKKKNITIYSLEHDISIDDMKSQGYEIVYDVLYSSYGPTLAELNAIRLKCSDESVLCAGGAAVASDNLLLVSCGNCFAVLTETPLNKPVLNNGAYWYLTDKKSFGFSPSSNIKQDNADWYDCDKARKKCTDDKRLSWWLSGRGGARLGKISHHESSLNNYRKIIMIS